LGVGLYLSVRPGGVRHRIWVVFGLFVSALALSIMTEIGSSKDGVPWPSDFDESFVFLSPRISHSSVA